jgi:hypothetical protein
MGDIERLEAEWRAAVEGMMFFGEPVQDMTAEQLLLVIGHLVTERKRLASELREREAVAIRTPAGGGYPLVDWN